MQDKFRRLIVKSLMEDLSQEEQQELAHWLNADHKNQQILEDVKRTWNRSLTIPSHFSPDTENAWKKVKSKIDVPRQNHSIKGLEGNEDYNTTHKSNSLHILWKAAAVILIVIGIGFMAIHITGNNNGQYTERAETYSATSQKSFVQLRDGSRVWLNKNTTLSCETDFNEKTRTVHVTGEAFFEIAKDISKPFIILSGSARTTVLGTAFNLRAYSHENRTELIVVHGKVSFANEHAVELVLEKGDKGIINNETEEITKSINKNLNFLAWKDERLLFDKTEFESVKKDIETYFSVNIEIASPAIRKCYFTGTFEKPELKDVLSVMRVTMNINHQKEKDKIVLSGNGCN